MTELFPAYADIADALLCFIYRRGGAISSSEAYDPLADYFVLSDQARAISRGEYFAKDDHPQLAWHCLVQWARRDLVKAAFLDGDAPRGIWRLTASGLSRGSLINEEYSEF